MWCTFLLQTQTSNLVEGVIGVQGETNVHLIWLIQAKYAYSRDIVADEHQIDAFLVCGAG